MNLEEIREYTSEMEEYMKLQLPILGVKMIRSGDEIPKEALRPVRDLGTHMCTCAALAVSARFGWVIAQTKEDMWCFEPVIGYGFEEPPEYFLEGHNRYPETARSLETGETWARNFPRFEYGVYKAIAFAPLKKIGFEPDLFMVYGFPGQILQLLLAKNWVDGLDVKPTVSGHAACVYSIVPVLKKDQIQVTVPCVGGVSIAGIPETYMIFSSPMKMISKLAEGLLHIKNTLFGLPYKPLLTSSPHFPESIIR